MKVGLIQELVGAGGGNDNYLEAMIESLREHDVTLYTLAKPLKPFKATHLKTKSILPFHVGMFGIYQHLFTSMLGRVAVKEDVVFILTGYPIIPKRKDQKIFFINQNNYGPKPDKKYRKGLYRLYYIPYKKLLTKFHKHLDNSITIISISKYAQERLLWDKKIDSVIMYPQVDIKSLKNNHEKIRRVITVGRYSQEKNLELFVDVVNRVKAEAVMIGTARPQQMPYYRRLKSSLGQDADTFVNIPRRQMLNWMKYSKVYFHAGVETFGFTIVESIACGCIPIVPDNSAHRETVPFDELRYRPDDVVEAANKVQAALDGKFDHLQDRLVLHINHFSRDMFNKNLSKLLGVSTITNE